ncbi:MULTISPECIES: hypothetical protein [Actinocorallia]|uniref:Excreted virulence factor EspC (Type VII ESX diderm) n=2 Tax=Actinocorallia TaxID=58108 RepID=A0ABP6HAV3_9ACTN
MTQIEKAAGQQVEQGGEGLGIVRFTLLVAELATAGAKLAGLSETVRGTYRYVEGCAESVERLADQMAALSVDADTVAEHREAAAVMRAALDIADAMAAGCEDLAALFAQASEAHQADYGSVAEAAQALTVPMADAQFYSNR